jgi:hypothetical protein
MKNIIYVCGYSSSDPLYASCKGLLDLYYDTKRANYIFFDDSEITPENYFRGERNVINLHLGLDTANPYYTPHGALNERNLWHGIRKNYAIYSYIEKNFDKDNIFYIHSVTSICVHERLQHFCSLMSDYSNVYAGNILFPAVLGQTIPMLSGAGRLISFDTVRKLKASYSKIEYLVENDLNEGILMVSHPKYALPRRDYPEFGETASVDFRIKNFPENFRRDLDAGQFHFRFRTPGLTNSERLNIDAVLMSLALDHLLSYDVGKMDSFMNLLKTTQDIVNSRVSSLN